jgi:hypothetical protein
VKLTQGHFYRLALPESPARVALDPMFAEAVIVMGLIVWAAGLLLLDAGRRTSSFVASASTVLDSAGA